MANSISHEMKCPVAVTTFFLARLLILLPLLLVPVALPFEPVPLEPGGAVVPLEPLFVACLNSSKMMTAKSRNSMRLRASPEVAMM